MKSTIIIKAPGKVILSGEHAVVYGKPSIASAIDLYLTFSLQKSSTTSKHKKIATISKIVTNYLTKNNILFTSFPYNFEIDSQIPVGFGLGSSAALSVASVAAFLFFYTGSEPKPEDVNNLAFKAEKLFHTNPSGVDNSASTYGGLIFFRREFEFLKTISALSFKIPKKIEDRLFLINSGKPAEKTKEMVQHVGTMYNKNAKNMERILGEIEKTTKQITVSLIKEDVSFFESTLVKNQAFLSEIGVVSSSAKRLLTDLSKYGVGKITGAGGINQGSGYILFSANDEVGMKTYLQKNNIQFYKFKQSHDGYRISSR